MKLLKLLWDTFGSEFGSRHLQYEMFYAGEPGSIQGREFRSFDWAAAEACLDELGLGWLAEVWTLDTDDGPLRVRIVQVAPDGVVVQTDDFGAIDVPVDRYDLPWPSPPELHP